MSSKERRYFSGNTLDNALLQAARHHGLNPEEVAYRKIEKRHGFIKSRKGVVIEVDPDSPRRAATTAAADHPRQWEDTGLPAPERPVTTGMEVEEQEPEEVAEVAADASAEEAEEEDEDNGWEEEAEPFSAETVDNLMEAARRGLQEMLAFARLDLEYEVSKGDGQLEIELRGPDRDRLLEERGNLILSIQHLLPRLVRGYSGRSIPCHVDSENFHESRRVDLQELAEEAATEVKQRQRSRTLPPMNPAERRIVHLALADDKEVNTESQGRGFFKRVTISPAMRRPRGFDRYNR